MGPPKEPEPELFTAMSPGLQPNKARPHQEYHVLAPEERRPGRPKGSRNKITNTFRDAMLLAAQEVGDSQEVGKDGKGGLLGYLKVCGVKERKTFMLMLARILPLKISAEIKQFKEKMSMEEAIAELKACGMDEMLAVYLKRYPIGTDEENTGWADMIDGSLAPDSLIDVTPESDELGNGTAK
jgi:hypothetical protein